eukprot:COSAG02_NODE_8256_length_2639_cov_2.416142_2_plen_77_part_00
MSPKYCNDTQAAVKEMNAAGMNNVHYLDITASSVGANASYMGCAGHPCGPHTTSPTMLRCCSVGPDQNDVGFVAWQ